MPISLVCPACKQRFDVDASQPGTAVACPHCAQLVALPQSASKGPLQISPIAEAPLRPADAPPPRRPAAYDDRADNYDDDDLGRPTEAHRWASTLSGLNLIYWCMLISLIATVVMQA